VQILEQKIKYFDIDFKEKVILIDVRTEKEYNESHIPGAHTFPILSDEERAEVGTIYKQV
jgi:tRNA 2-selenouridine synthase